MDIMRTILSDYTLQVVSLGSALLGIVSGVVGSFAVIRKESLLGDAVSHAALPGIALAFIFTNTRNTEVLLLGALLSGLLATFIIVGITRYSRVKFDSSLALILSVFFGIGLVLLTYIQRIPNADQAGLSTFIFGQASTLLLRDVRVMAILGFVILILIALFWKEFKIVSFDIDFAESLGFNTRRITIILFALIVTSIIIGLQIVGAALMGVATVYIIEILHSTKLVSEDSSIGIVFPLLFSIAIIIISRYAGSVHLDTDSVLLGELAYAPFNRLYLFGRDLGPKSIYSMGIILIINIIFIAVFFKELKLVTFDPALATILGFSPALIHYALMTLVSITAVGAFESVGSILVVAFMVGPPVSAYLLTDDLKIMIALSALIGALNGVAGYQLSSYLDVSIAGSIALMTGITFLIVFILAPSRGLLTALRRRRRQRNDFAEKSLLFHIYNHEGMENVIKLTDKGREYAIESYEKIISET